YYRTRRGLEPVGRFIESLPAKPAAKIVDYIEQHLNGKRVDEPPPQIPITSQIEGGLRELQSGSRGRAIEFSIGGRGARAVCCTLSRRTPDRSPPSIGTWRSSAGLISSAGWKLSHESLREQLARTRRRLAGFTKIDKVTYVDSGQSRERGPAGRPAVEA